MAKGVIFIFSTCMFECFPKLNTLTFIHFYRVNQVLLVLQVHPVCKVSQDCQDMMEYKGVLVKKVLKENQVCLVTQGPQDPLVYLEKKANGVPACLQWVWAWGLVGIFPLQ